MNICVSLFKSGLGIDPIVLNKVLNAAEIPEEWQREPVWSTQPRETVNEVSSIIIITIYSAFLLYFLIFFLNFS